MRLCCVIGNALRARSKVLRVDVTLGCFIRNFKYISQMRGILFKRINARSKSTFTFLYSPPKTAAFSLSTCLTRKLKYYDLFSDDLLHMTTGHNPYHLPKLIGSRKLSTGPLHDESLLDRAAVP
jgi:hypothetical protein